MHCFTFSSQIFFQFFLLTDQSWTSFVNYQFEKQTTYSLSFPLDTMLFCKSYKTLRLPHTCCCASTEGIESEAFISLHRLDVTPFCPGALSGEENFVSSPFLSLCFTSCTPWLPRNSTAPLPWVQQGGEDRQLQHSHPLAHPDNSYFQRVTFCFALFMDSFTLSTQTPSCHHLKSPEVIHSWRAAPLCLACAWDVSGSRVQKSLFCSCK